MEPVNALQATPEPTVSLVGMSWIIPWWMGHSVTETFSSKIYVPAFLNSPNSGITQTLCSNSRTCPDGSPCLEYGGAYLCTCHIGVEPDHMDVYPGKTLRHQHGELTLWQLQFQSEVFIPLSWVWWNCWFSPIIKKVNDAHLVLLIFGSNFYWVGFLTWTSLLGFVQPPPCLTITVVLSLKTSPWFPHPFLHSGSPKSQ